MTFADRSGFLLPVAAFNQRPKIPAKKVIPAALLMAFPTLVPRAGRKRMRWGPQAPKKLQKKLSPPPCTHWILAPDPAALRRACARACGACSGWGPVALQGLSCPGIVCRPRGAVSGSEVQLLLGEPGCTGGWRYSKRRAGKPVRAREHIFLKAPRGRRFIRRKVGNLERQRVGRRRLHHGTKEQINRGLAAPHLLACSRRLPFREPAAVRVGWSRLRGAGALSLAAGSPQGSRQRPAKE